MVELVDTAVFKTEALGSVRVRVPPDASPSYQPAFFAGGESMRLKASSNPIPGSFSSSLGKLGSGLGFDGLPDLVAGDLRAVGEALAFDAFEGRVRALHIVDSKGDPVVPAKVKLGRVTLQVLLADAVERAIEATLENGEG